ncbi:uncharacterized protein Z520_10175 [Fonsecaea multimorphosa CBS 102226]|uniref:CipC-like antibiotic response protein n=1 Tax=Fonsecaea multimorphosa CBS 102226 TaxID=1442371 RepID=A0A0D2JUG2_9EURO|nr:uncharacterized protein Z520_10175 [Fonsecaea multimorphosa CBS 102226]KIX94149.1 hypothetical protein Z520_10175 [Fonsecaea multimorphosa CBS 102226]
MVGCVPSHDTNKKSDNGDDNHEAKFSHEVIGGAAAFEGMKLYEDRQRREGKTVNHGFAKEVLAGFVGAEVDKLAETKGLDEYDKIRAREHAKKSAENMYDQHYGDMDQYDPNQRDQPNFNY